MKTFIIEELKNIVDQFSPVQCDFPSENCITAFEKHKHFSGCQVRLTSENEVQEFSVQWQKEIVKEGYRESVKVIEHAAEAISFFLSRTMTDYNIIEEARIGTGFDYWLGYDEKSQLYDPLNFMKARLEISGIDKESAENTIERRIKTKERQTSKSDDLNLPAYISIVEFSTPKAFFGKK